MKRAVTVTLHLSTNVALGDLSRADFWHHIFEAARGDGALDVHDLIDVGKVITSAKGEEVGATNIPSRTDPFATTDEDEED